MVNSAEIDRRNSLLGNHLVSHDVYISVFRNHPDIVYVVDADGYFQDCNDSACAQFGYSREEWIDKRIGYFTPGEDHPGLIQAFTRALAGMPQQIEITAQHRNGSKLHIDLVLVPAVVGDQVVGVYGFGRDISMQREIQDELLRNETRMHHAQEIAKFGIWEYDLVSRTGASSEQLRLIFGFDDNPSSLEDYYARLHPDDSERVTRINKDQNLREKSLTEFRIIRPDGEIRTLLSHWKLLRSEDGIPLKVYGVFQDITERKLIEEELRRSQDQLAKAQSIAHLGDWSWNLISGELKLSKESLCILGLSQVPIALNRDHVLSVVHPENRNSTQSALEQLIEVGYLRFHECRIIRPDKTERTVCIHGHSVCREHGRATRIVGTIQDVTEQRRTEDIIRNSDKLSVIGQLAAGIAHEIRNPLATLKGFLQLTQQLPDRDKTTLDRYLGYMMDAINHLEFISGEMLVLSKPHVKEMRHHNIIGLLTEIIQVLNAEALLNSVELTFNPDFHCIDAVCDHNEIKQVFINVIKNGIESMEPGGVLNIDVRQGENQVTIQFTDTGCGILPERLAHICEPFYTTKEKGTGLGLMVCRKILDEHKGTIDFESIPGDGTTVFITLPTTA